VNPGNERGSKTVFIRADAPDVVWFDATLDRIADGIALLGDTTSKDTRRARAVGIIANPQHTLNVFHDAAAAYRQADPAGLSADMTRLVDVDETVDGEDPAGSPELPAASGSPSRVVRVDPRPPATLYVHVDADTVRRGGDGVARVEGVGPVTVEQARRWLGHCAVTVKTVIDLAGLAPVDGYEIPDRLREAVRLLSPADVFPYASNTSRRLDLDHTTPYLTSGAGDDGDGGGGPPPGQTRVGNLGPMTRFHHRLKTFGRWQVAQPFPGIYLWRTPHGRVFLVDHTGTRKLPRTA
jgi:hypothetical protein